MILNYPSGFYRTVLPPAADSRGNVTYTISNELPPRGALFFLKMNNNLAASSPSLIASVPQGIINGSAIKSFRNVGTVDRSARAMGSVLEFSGPGANPSKALAVQQDALNEAVDFPRFNDTATTPVNKKLVEAYKQFQQQLMVVAQSSLSKQVEIENIERTINVSHASLSATREALKILIDDPDLQQAQDQLIIQIEVDRAQIAVLRQEIVVLDAKRNSMTDSVRNLSKVIS